MVTIATTTTISSPGTTTSASSTTTTTPLAETDIPTRRPNQSPADTPNNAPSQGATAVPPIESALLSTANALSTWEIYEGLDDLTNDDLPSLFETEGFKASCKKVSGMIIGKIMESSQIQ